MLSWVSVPYLFHTRSRPNKVFSTYSPCIIVGTSKRQSSFHTLQINYAIQTLRIRQHRNVHSGQKPYIPGIPKGPLLFSRQLMCGVRDFKPRMAAMTKDLNESRESEVLQFSSFCQELLASTVERASGIAAFAAGTHRCALKGCWV